MTFRDAVVVVQMLTMVTLAFMFIRDGLWPLGGAQICYVIATFLLFIVPAVPSG